MTESDGQWVDGRRPILASGQKPIGIECQWIGEPLLVDMCQTDLFVVLSAYHRGTFIQSFASPPF